ncbi:MAG: M14 family zinc carboxypeptidase [Bacteroidales bacterium]|nr:M14 family zinc carboxypeptidase [Bacteroidales bacterium]MDZ4203469.1 M14 family zinc carboxypeptidase [Bacteroidales bacterium]
MKKLILTLFVCWLSLSLSAQQLTYSRVKIYTNPEGIAQLAELGISFENAEVKHRVFIIAELSSQEIDLLAGKGFQYEILIEDMTAWYLNRNNLPESSVDIHTGTALAKDYPVPTGFSLGSHAGFCTYSEFLDHLDQLHSMYPAFITQKQPVISTLTTIEGRPVFMVRISNNPNVYQENKPKVLYTGMIHAREPIGMQHLLYFMYYILQHYPIDPQIKYLIDNTELYFVPVVNPDGYLFNEQEDPLGGGMWRKNRRMNFDSSVGVDLNRNFGFMWGYNNTGSSSTPSYETYRGTAPFSEPETHMLRHLCQTVPFSIALNYHSHGNLLLYPWGYIAQTTPDDAILANFAKRMTAENKYVYGIGSTTIYQTNGGSDDWMYGDQSTKDKIFSYTPEIGTSSDGFWPAINRIIPQCQENMLQSLLAGLFTLRYGILSDRGSLVTDVSQGHIVFDLQRMGLQEGGSFTVSLGSLNAEVISLGSPKMFSGLGMLQTVTDSISYTLAPSTPQGTVLKFLLSLNNGHFTKTDTITRVFGTVVTPFYDDCSTLNNWTGNWGLSTSSSVSPPASITDSPSGFYSFNSNRSTTSTAIDLSNALYARLKFWARWSVEVNYDYVQVKLSTNNGATWIPLAGKYTRSGSIYQTSGQPVYDGVQSDWVYEEIDLGAYVGQSVKIRFTLVSDNSVNADGFYFDDITVTMIGATPNLAAHFTSGEKILGIYPNPSTGLFRIQNRSAAALEMIEVLNLTGNKILSKRITDGLANLTIVDLTDHPQGLYFLRITTQQGIYTVKAIVSR